MRETGWAKKVIARTFQAHKGPLTGYAVKALLAEHKRAVRVVETEMKRVKLDQHNYSVVTRAEMTTCLERLLAALQKGRT